jgi:hypothetical protein
MDTDAAHVIEAPHVRPTSLENGAAIGIAFYLPDGVTDARPFEAKL